ncbi:gliding motility-associated C-terminal domain-containing protein [Hymenobacter edaphi]|uniref:Gliding motility-associated C-terminal domain-containing protein n=1 Tax=Hymenobacter edaphi TaxID=2211146 RepID=A0A328BJU8_9BACT|nr:gliding motility-associated C-terminal domain-containing protein [Hymenobacter edaphi]RAK66681.1 hypothetical protein DLM85_10700 [Hymenobacter edaphi]
MKHLLRASLLLLTAWCLALSGVQQAYASHAQGGQLTYEYIGTPAQPNRYRVTCRFFRDCSGIDAPTQLTLNCRIGTPTTSCSGNDSRNFQATLVRGLLTTGTPYCTSAGNPCGTTGRTNYETAKYEAIVTLVPAPSWTLSVSENARPTLANVTPSSIGDMYFEAVLNNQLTLASGSQLNINNTSPQYLDQDIPIPFVCKEQRTTLTFSTFEPDGDSLVYSLDRALEGCNQPMNYKALPGSGITVISTNPPCVLSLNTGSGGSYSPTFPIPSFSLSGSCPVQTGTPSFLFNATTGSVTFTPYFFDANVPANNKYVVVGKVTEFRKINGRYYQVGSVRRDMLVVVIDCGGNTVPNPPVATGVTPGNPNPINLTDSTVVDVFTCNYSQIKVRFSDPNPGQQLTVTVPAGSLTPLDDIIVPNGYVLSGNGTTTPVMTFYFQPSPQLVGTTIRIPVRIEDNACPIKGVQNRIIVIRVKQGQFATAVAAATAPGQSSTDPVICYGTSLNIRGSVTRPDSVRNGLQQYSFRWAAAPGLPAAQQNSQSITVNPTQTTRYRLTIAPTIGYSQGCGDTTSIRVRVAPQVVAAFKTDSAAVAGSRFNRPPRVFTFTNQSLVNNVITTVGLDSIRWTYQRVKNSKGEAVTEAPVRFWGRSTQPPALTLSKPGVYVITLSVANRTPGVTCPESTKRQTVTVPEQNMPNVFTPNKDGLNDTFIVQTEMVGSKVEIFNRWGRKVKEYATYNNEWDGDTQPSGVYYYQITARDGSVTKGWVELVR